MRILSEDAAFYHLFHLYKYQAKGRDLVFSLTQDQFKILTQGKCFYCGIAPIHVHKHRNRIYLYNGVDRLDNTMGYVIENCVSCCPTHNRMKFQMSPEQFIEACRSVANFQK